MALKIVPKSQRDFVHSRKISLTCQGLKAYDKTMLKLILSVFKVVCPRFGVTE